MTEDRATGQCYGPEIPFKKPALNAAGKRTQFLTASLEKDWKTVMEGGLRLKTIGTSLPTSLKTCLRTGSILYQLSLEEAFRLN